LIEVVTLIEQLAQDARHGLRMLLKNPGFTAMAVLTLALGIGATAAVCSLIQGVLSTPPLYRKPEQLILITPESLDRRYRLSAGVSGHGADSVPDPGEVGPGQTLRTGLSLKNFWKPRPYQMDSPGLVIKPLSPRLRTSRRHRL